MKLFGLITVSAVHGSEIIAETAEETKQSKKRGSLFRRKKDGESDSATTEPSQRPVTIAEGDDKYGQTKEFHDAIASLSPGEIRSAFWTMVKHDHPDALLLRFLRARKWDVEKALVMMVSTLRWRTVDMHVDDDIMKNGELQAALDSQSQDLAHKRLGEGFIAQLRMGKNYTHGRDMANRPCSYIRVRLHKAGEYSEESTERLTVYGIETARMLLEPPVDTAVCKF